MIPHRIGLGLGIQSVPAIVGGGLASGWPAWVYPHPSLVADLDFLGQIYAWAGLPRVQGDFDGWTNVTHTPSEGVTTAAARGIVLAASRFASGSGLTLAVSTKGISVPGSTNVIAEIWDGTSSESLRVVSSAANWTAQARDVNVAQATFNFAVDTGVKHAFSIGNKDGTSFRSGRDGAALTPVTTGTAAGPFTQLVIGQTAAYIRRVLVFQALLSDAEHAAVTTWLLANA